MFEWEILPTPKRAGVCRARNAYARLLLPGHRPSAWRLQHLGLQQTARLGDLVLTMSSAPRLGVVPSRAKFPNPNFPRDERETRELACLYSLHAWLYCERYE